MAHPGQVPLVVSSTLEPGDRFEIPRALAGRRLALPDFLQAQEMPIEQLEDEAGTLLAVQQNPHGNGLVLPESARIETPAWLEYRAPGRFRLVGDKAPAVPATTEVR